MATGPSDAVQAAAIRVAGEIVLESQKAAARNLKADGAMASETAGIVALVAYKIVTEYQRMSREGFGS